MFGLPVRPCVRVCVSSSVPCVRQFVDTIFIKPFARIASFWNDDVIRVIVADHRRLGYMRTDVLHVLHDQHACPRRGTYF